MIGAKFKLIYNGPLIFKKTFEVLIIVNLILLHEFDFIFPIFVLVVVLHLNKLESFGKWFLKQSIESEKCTDEQTDNRPLVIKNGNLSCAFMLTRKYFSVLFNR